MSVSKKQAKETVNITLIFLVVEQGQILSKIFVEVFKERQPKNMENDINSAVLKIVRSLIKHSNSSIFEDRFSEICEFILGFKSSRSSHF